VLNELTQPFVGRFLLLLLQGGEHTVDLTRPKLIHIPLHPLVTLSLLKSQGIGGVIKMRFEMRMIQDILSSGKHRHDGFTQPLVTIAGHHHLSARRHSLKTAHLKELF
jgi:hypothetical protein